MTTVILPGFSPKNLVWSQDIFDAVSPVLPVSIQRWKHWESGKPTSGWMKEEAYKFIVDYQDEVNIIAKSIGTAVAMIILKSKPEIVNKIIFCGVPVLDFHTGDEKLYKPLIDFPAENFICFQNKNDDHGSFAKVKSFLHSFNPDLKIVSKPRSDHEYPYPKNFISFLAS